MGVGRGEMKMDKQPKNAKAGSWGSRPTANKPPPSVGQRWDMTPGCGLKISWVSQNKGVVIGDLIKAGKETLGQRRLRTSTLHRLFTLVSKPE